MGQSQRVGQTLDSAVKIGKYFTGMIRNESYRLFRAKGQRLVLRKCEWNFTVKLNYKVNSRMEYINSFFVSEMKASKRWEWTSLLFFCRGAQDEEGRVYMQTKMEENPLQTLWHPKASEMVIRTIVPLQHYQTYEQRCLPPGSTDVIACNACDSKYRLPSDWYVQIGPTQDSPVYSRCKGQ